MRTKKEAWKNNLGKLREKAGLSLKDVGQIVGKANTTVRFYEIGKVQPNVRTLLKLAKLYGCTVEEINEEKISIETDFILDRAIRKHARRDIADIPASTYTKVQVLEYPYNLVTAICKTSPEKVTLSRDIVRKIRELDENAQEIVSSIANINLIDFPLTEAQQKGLDVALDTLESIEKEVILLRYKEGLTLEEIGKMHGVTRERVRQIEKKALYRMRHPGVYTNIKYGVQEEIQPVKRSVNELPLALLSISPKTIDKCATFGIHTVGDFLQHVKDNRKGFGQITKAEVLEGIAKIIEGEIYGREDI